MKLKIFISLLILCLYSGIDIAQTLNKAKLDSLFNTLVENKKAMGSVAISKNGKIVYTNAFGYSQFTDRITKPATTLTKYRIGSITKMFTATMIFQLIDEGKLKLTTTLDTYFPDIPDAHLITISHLLNHRSGLHNFTDDQAYMGWMTLPKTHDEMLAIFAKNKSDFAPNEKASYSNTNYVLLGYIIEKITNKTYAVNLTERITSKIGLTDTYVGGKTNPNNNESYSFEFTNTWEQGLETDMSIPGGAGSIISTPTDLTKFIEALFSNKIISKENLKLMKTMTDHYGMGMFQMPFYDKTGFGHNGGIDNFASDLGYFPEDSLAVAYCSNGQVYSVNDIMIGILSIYFNRDYTIPKFNTITLKPEELDKYLGLYSSAQLPLKITISKRGSTLMGQATGQPAFALDATEKDKFKFDQAGIVMEFHPETHELMLKQGGGTYLFTLEK